MSTHLREEEFVSYLDARLSPAERTRLDEHLAACAACRTQLDEFRGLMGLLGEWKAVEPSPEFDAALRARLAEEAPGRTRWGWFRPAYAAAALALAGMIAVGVVLWQPMAPEPVPPAAGVERPPRPPVVGDDLAVVENPVLLEDYELLEEFDALFEPEPQEEEKL